MRLNGDSIEIRDSDFILVGRLLRWLSFFFSNRDHRNDNIYTIDAESLIRSDIERFNVGRALRN